MELEDQKEKLKLVASESDETPSTEVGDSHLMAEQTSSDQQGTIRAEDEITFETEENDDDLIGQTIGGHYEILSRIGSGGMSTVYKARHTLLDKFVAIKFILPKLIYDKQTAKRFQQEAKAATELHHENICAVKEFEIHKENRAFLVMDYLDGKSLTDVIAKEGKLSSRRALDIAAQICTGLSHAHSKNVIHRDIKPANIVLVKDGRGEESVRIVDFGLAKLLRNDPANPNLTQSGEVFGTPNYMSPEQCLGRGVDVRSDIYSFGCLMHEMYLGRPPFQASSNIEVIMNHVNDSPEIKGADDVEVLILKCLEKSPDKRYATADQLLEDINSLRGNEKLVHAKKDNTSKTRTRIGIALILIFLGMACFLALRGFDTMNSNRILQREWRAETNNASKLIQQNRWGEAEESLEKAVELAQRSHNSDDLTFSLSTLSNVEQSRGKIDEARMHADMAFPKPDMAKFRQLGLIAAAVFTITGVLIFVFFVVLFGPEGKFRKFLTTPLKEYLGS